MLQQFSLARTKDKKIRKYFGGIAIKSGRTWNANLKDMCYKHRRVFKQNDMRRGTGKLLPKGPDGKQLRLVGLTFSQLFHSVTAGRK